jgi:hypothetical protein
MTMIQFLIFALVLLVVLYVCKIIVDYLELDPPIRKIVLLIVGLIGLLALLNQLGFIGGRLI